MTMLGGIVERNRAIEVRSRFRDLPGVKQRQAFEAMADHAGPGRALLFRQRQELDGELMDHVPVECDEVRDPGAVKHDKQQIRIFGRLSESFRLFDQVMRALDCGFRFRRGIAAKMKERGNQRDLKLDLLAAQRRTTRQCRYKIEGARDLLCSFNQRRPLQRPLTGFAPPFDCRLGHGRLGEVMSQ